MTQPLPATVKVAFWFQIAVVAMLTLFIGACIARAVQYDGLISEAALATGANPADVADERSYNLSGTLFPAIPALVLAVWLGVTAFLVRRGNNVGRILTLVGMAAPIVLSLLGCLVGGFGVFLVFGFLIGGFDEEPYADEPFPEDFPTTYPGEAFYDKLAALDAAGWSAAFEVITFTAFVLAFACAIVTAVMLLVGPSNRFFRPGRPAGGHPLGYAPFPAPYAPFGPPAYAAPFAQPSSAAPFVQPPFPPPFAQAGYPAPLGPRYPQPPFAPPFVTQPPFPQPSTLDAPSPWAAPPAGQPSPADQPSPEGPSSWSQAGESPAPSSEPTPPSSEPTPPSSECTPPSSECTPPSSESTPPSSESTPPSSEPTPPPPDDRPTPPPAA
ncbi:hypothetical protein [Paractinoplanes deccanensis]|uniref:hypothetical protein n=1 Tax=Paractinoplanes deccanensis TaxID=113561 RepID=UPI0031DE2C78